jgi:uncharacterized protein
MSAPLSPTEVFDQLSRGIAESRWHELADLYAENAVVDMPMHPRRVHIEGRDGIRQHFEAAAGSIELRPHNIIVHTTADPEVVIAEFEYHGRDPANGSTFNVANVQVLRVRDGQIVSTRDYHDHAGIAAGRRAHTD